MSSRLKHGLLVGLIFIALFSSVEYGYGTVIEYIYDETGNLKERRIPPTLTSISVSPPSASVAPNGTQQFTATARDQVGNPLVPQPSFTWTVSGGGTINSREKSQRGQTATFNKGVNNRGNKRVEAIEDSVSGSFLSCDLPGKRKKDGFSKHPRQGKIFVLS
jgi:hypothetical protein